ncbi:MAG: MerR family transcriptional regulator [Myxococcales bacterium]|nr:MerR family transcriptional regulator [Myxococcota bacterium]MDW8283414.1 MerR family transcriptional regulator [Myxococcales bacterium]
MAQRPGRGKRQRGLGALGRLSWQRSVPELTLLPARSEFSAADVREASGLRAAQLDALQRTFPELAPVIQGRRKRYSRAQVEQLLRVKRLHLEMGLSPEQVRQQLAVLRPPAVLPLPPRTVLPADAIEQMRAELQAIVDLCKEE